MRAHLAPGHAAAGRPAKNWDFDALAGAGAIRSTADDMLRYLKANMGNGASPFARRDAIRTTAPQRRDPGDGRVGLAWMTTGGGIVWHNGGTGGYAGPSSASRPTGSAASPSSRTRRVLADDLGFGDARCERARSRPRTG